MKIQMVCLANSFAEGGRILVGILVRDGIPLVDAVGPRWIKLALAPQKPIIPTGMVVDIVPRDILEFEALLSQGEEECNGTVVFDPYSLRFLGVMNENLIANYCAKVGNRPIDMVFMNSKIDGFALLDVQSCSLEAGKQEASTKRDTLSLKFLYGGICHKYRIDDPWFLEVLQSDPEILIRKSHHRIVLHGRCKRGQESPTYSVMAVMV